MNRRDLFRAGAAGFAGLTTIGSNAQTPAPTDTSAAATLITHDVNWRPQILDAHQNETVVALAEVILPKTDTPGAADAKVNRYLDLFLARDDELRHSFLEGLNLLDGHAMQAYSLPFAQCTGEQQSALLSKFESASGANLEKEREFFQLAKSLTARIYFNTPEGFQELNKFGVPRNPSCEHVSHG